MRWKTITTHPAYEVSDTGLVRRVGGDPRGKRGVLRPDTSTEYARVVLHSGGRPARRNVHLLVLEAFKGPAPSPRHVGNHKDGRKLRNVISNLEWATKSEDRLHCCRVLKKGQGVTNGRAKLTEAGVRAIRRDLAAGLSVRAVADRHRVHRGTVYFIREGRQWAHVE